MTSPSRSAYHHGDLAQSLIEAAAAMLAVKGAGQLSLREIARNAGVSHGAPAHHFGDKSGLLTAVAIAGYRHLADQLRASQEGSETVYSRLSAAGRAYVQFAVEQRGYFSIMFQAEYLHAEQPEFLAARDEAKAVLAACVRELAGDQAVNQHALDAMLTALWSQVHGFSVLWLSGNFGNPDDKQHLDIRITEMLSAIEPGFPGA